MKIYVVEVDVGAWSMQVCADEAIRAFAAFEVDQSGPDLKNSQILMSLFSGVHWVIN